MRRIIIVIVALLAVAFILFSLTELESILDVLRESNPLILLIAIGLEVVSLINTAAIFEALYRLVGLKEDRGRMLLMTTAANFVNMVAPSGGVGGIAVFLDDARQRNLPSGRVMVTGILYLLYEYTALFCILAIGFGILIQRHNLNAIDWIAAGLLLALALAVAGMLLLGYRSAEQLGNVLATLSQWVNRLTRSVIRRDILNTENAHAFSREMAEGLSFISGSKGNLLRPLFFTLNNKALQLCMLACSFLALNTPFTLATIVGGYSISTLFFYMSPTPSGVGFVEGILPSSLARLGVPFTEAILITLTFRALTIWFPFAVGAVMFRVLQNPPRASSNRTN